MPRADELFGGTEVVAQGDIFIADIDNNETEELLFAWNEGSGSYLNVLIVRGATDQWVIAESTPLDDELSGARRYYGPAGKELIARVCGKTIINLLGGNEPGYYPHALIWEGNTVRRVCSAPWLNRQRAAAAELVKRDRLDDARVLLDGVQQGCEKESPAEVRAIRNEVAQIAATTAAASAATYDFSWLISEIKVNQNEQVVHDSRFRPMLVRIVPDARLEHASLRGALTLSVSLPGEVKVIEDRYVLIEGCEPHNCGNSGFVWIDTVAKQGVAMTNGVLASKTTAASQIPPLFWVHTRSTDASWRDGEIAFIDAAGNRTTVKAP